ncbi:nuclear transport factor 2 family protein [Cryptosporangium aurantiacum]|uniref:SnoaL-like domain-containing protein n=1 Tax=Cryptosporangium aurantiacum TaxID=134849 RepID=A0A1M7RJK1_9ACTN|nr:nuclear transport factor 2 family protein [Cryptosporangium aurantiacum]SHN46525.1 SnoaL-like domain-containing protein [Cryptosporangium aurantiacum]
MSDRSDIHDALNAYAWAIDSRDFRLLATDVFADDVVADYGLPEPLRSADAVVAFMDRAHRDLDATQHLIGNVTVRLSGDSATSRSYAHATLIRRGAPGGNRVVFAAYYEDEWVRTTAGWRIRSRVARMFFRDGNPRVLDSSTIG